MIIEHQGEKIELEENSAAKDLAIKLKQTNPEQAIIAKINGELCDLKTPVNHGDDIEFLDFTSCEAKEVFWHTSAHILAQAVLRIWPQAQPTIGPPIDNGFYYDFAKLEISESDFPKIEKEAKKIISENLTLIPEVFKDKNSALDAFGSNPFKKELIESFDSSSKITGYRQGEFFDLCRGPHLFSTGKVKAFKILKTSGAYWKGNSDNEMLTRIYGISFPSKEQLKAYLFLIEEAKKRDHRVIGAKLDLFSFKEEAPAMPFFHSKGMVIWDNLYAFWKEIHLDANYEIIKTPHMLTQNLWTKSGHWEHYRENMFIVAVDEQRSFAIKPMNCPGCMLFYNATSHSYRDLPLKIAEFGLVHRKEPSGALNGLFRVQSFHQDDAHLFMQPCQIKDEILEVLKLVRKIYHTFGLEYTLELSTRPEKSIGTDADWDIATKGLQDALEAWGEKYEINKGDGAFYGPKIDLHVLDALGRKWQCGTVQLDMALPERFELEYKDKNGELKRPIMLHRAIFGSMERFLGILIEHFKGKFPLWLSPNPLVIIPVAKTHHEYAIELKKQFKDKGLDCVIDLSEDSLGKKIRAAQIRQTNYMITIGDNEVQNNSLSLRTRDNTNHGEQPISNFINSCKKEIKQRLLTSPYTN